jgi:hypothetical protein
MRGGNKMTYSLDYAERIGREILQDRRREAERERLIRQVSGWNPPLHKKMWLIIQSRWEKRKNASVQLISPQVPDAPSPKVY